MAHLNITGFAVGLMLLAIQNNGIHITHDGRLVDYRLRPGVHANPRSAGGKTPFTDSEVELLRLWMATASGAPRDISPFEALENVLPTHSFLAWKSKWKEGGVQKLPPVTLRNDAPYINLRSSRERTDFGKIPPAATDLESRPTLPPRDQSPCTSGDPTHTPTPLDAASSSGSTDGVKTAAALEPLAPVVEQQPEFSPRLRQHEAASYYELRADRLSNVLRHLDLEDEAAFEKWMAQPFVRSAYNEVYKSMIVPELAEVEATRAKAQRPCYNETASSLYSRVGKAMDALNNPSSKFRSPDPQKCGWMKDDHSVWFIVSVVLGGRAPGASWSHLRAPEHEEQLCQKALVLLRWLQWVHRPAGGDSPDSIRRQAHKDVWRAKLAKLLDSNSTSTADPTSRPSTRDMPTIPPEQPTGTTVRDTSCLRVVPVALVPDLSSTPVHHPISPTAGHPCPVTSTPRSEPQVCSQTPAGTSTQVHETTSGRGQVRTLTQSALHSSNPLGTLSALAATSLFAAAIVLPRQAHAVLMQPSGLRPAPSLPVSADPDQDLSVLDTVPTTPPAGLPIGLSGFKGHGHLELGSKNCEDSGELSESDRNEPINAPQKRLRGEGPDEGQSHKRLKVGEDDQQSEPVQKPAYRLGASSAKPVDGVKTPSITALDIPDYPLTSSDRQPQVKGAAWLTAAAYRSWQNEVTHRLAGWGIGPAHVESCVLVPEAWKRRFPSDLLEDSRYLSLDEDIVESGRMTRTYGDMTVLWARAAAWFSVWPRRGVDLDVFAGAGIDNGYGKMHGSHRCHQGLCILPSHICFERDFLNLYRNSCKAFARQLRRYNMEIPVHCLAHKPPCLLQRAALTATEAVHIQFSVLREAKNLPEVPPPDMSPPDRFTTFEYRLPVTFKAESPTGLLTYRSRLVTPPDVPFAPRDKVFVCPFCDKCQQGWSMIDHYWAHLRNPEKHGDEVPDAARLQAVIDSGALYLEWQARRAYDYTYNNKRIAEMVQQTQLGNFDMETFRNWTLHVRKPKATLSHTAAANQH
ncbi:hypothetical protein ABEF95_004071 [Exophiala dermatitidis]